MSAKPQAQIRLLATADAARFRNVRLEALKREPQAFGSTFERENGKPLSWFEERITQTDIFGAFAEGELVGLAGYRAQEDTKAHQAVLWGMYVRAEARNSGLGRRLVEAVVRHACERVEQLQLTVASENRPAHRLYASLGFVEYGREVRGLKQDGRYYDEILMVKFLAPDQAPSQNRM